MDDIFDDEEISEVVATIQELCSKLNWTMKAISADDSEGGISGLILGNDDFFDDLGLDAAIFPDTGNLH